MAKKKIEGTKAEKFQQLATSRMNKALKAIQLIRKLANTSNYEWTDTQVDAMVKALNRETAKVEKALKNPSNAKVEDSFTF